MDKQSIFDKDISLFWHCEVRDNFAASDLRRTLSNSLHKINEKEFRRFLASAIHNNTYSIERYEELTGIDFESIEEVANDLRNLWQQLFGGAIQP